jgi:hypothetical protein
VRVSDGSLVAERSFAITVANVAPTLTVTGAATVAEGATYTITLGATDPGADTISEWTIAWGDGTTETVAGATTSVNHVYATDGSYVVQVSAQDEDGSYAAAPLNVTVTNVNVAPVADAQSVATDEDTALAIQLSGSDADGGTLSYAIATPPVHGTLSGFNAATGQVTYTPDADYFGPDSFEFTVSDGQGGAATAVVSIDVRSVNDAPVLAALSNQFLASGGALSIQLIGSDPDVGDVLTYTLLTGPAGMTLDADTGLLAWTAPQVGAFTVYPVAVQVSDGQGGTALRNFDVVVDSDVLQVVSFTPTETGFKIRFNQSFDASRINLYGPAAVNLGTADLSLLRSNGTAVAGSVVLDDDARGLTFVRTGGVLPTGTYTVRLESRSSAFVDLQGRLLDGDLDGTAGGHYLNTFAVTGGRAVLGIGELARGPGQALSAPYGSTTLPITLGNAAGAERVEFTLAYDAALLNISAASLGRGLPAGSSIVSSFAAPGRLHVVVTLGSALGSGTVELVRLTGTVPVGATYGGMHVLDLQSVEINDGAIAARDDDGLHLAAYVGDANGDRRHSRNDLDVIRRVLNGRASGFEAYPLADPVLVGDTGGNGVITSRDLSLLLREFTGRRLSPIPDIPRLPGAGAAPAAANLGPLTQRSALNVDDYINALAGRSEIGNAGPAPAPLAVAALDSTPVEAPARTAAPAVASQVVVESAAAGDNGVAAPATVPSTSQPVINFAGTASGSPLLGSQYGGSSNAWMAQWLAGRDQDDVRHRNDWKISVPVQRINLRF